MHAKNGTIRCLIRETNNDILCIKLHKRMKVNIEDLHMLCPCLFFILTIHTESQLEALGLCLEGVYVWKDLWDSLQVNLYSVNLFSGGLIFWDLTVCQLSSI